MSQDTPAASVIPALEAFSALLSSWEHKLARGGDDKLASGALDAAKDICDLGMSRGGRR
jgi:hypothetical protein